MTFRPELLRYKGRRCAGAHSHTLLPYRGIQIVFTAEGGLLTVSITGRFTQRFPAREILDYLGFNTVQPVDESVTARYGGGVTHIYQQALKDTDQQQAL